MARLATMLPSTSSIAVRLLSALDRQELLPLGRVSSLDSPFDIIFIGNINLSIFGENRAKIPFPNNGDQQPEAQGPVSTVSCMGRGAAGTHASWQMGVRAWMGISPAHRITIYRYLQRRCGVGQRAPS